MFSLIHLAVSSFELQKKNKLLSNQYIGSEPKQAKHASGARSIPQLLLSLLRKPELVNSARQPQGDFFLPHFWGVNPQFCRFPCGRCPPPVVLNWHHPEPAAIPKHWVGPTGLLPLPPPVLGKVVETKQCFFLNPLESKVTLRAQEITSSFM